MARKVIDLTTPQPNGKMGEPTKSAWEKTNDNFSEIYGEGLTTELFWSTKSTGGGASFTALGKSNLPNTIAYKDSENTFTSKQTFNAENNYSQKQNFTLIQSEGIRSRNNIAYGPNYISFEWVAGMRMWVDGNDVGIISTVSDPRIKHMWETVEGGDLDDVLSVVPKTWRYKDISIWSDDGIRRRSFNSNDLEDIDPLLVSGDRNAVNKFNGTPQPQNIDPLAVCSKLWGALREEAFLRIELEDKLKSAIDRISQLELNKTVK